jgi:hypothetical protein
LPTAFESAIKAMIAYGVTAVNNKPTALTLVITANRIEANPTAWSLFAFTG